MHAAADSGGLTLQIPLEIGGAIFAHRLNYAQSLEPDIGGVLFQLLEKLLFDGRARVAVERPLSRQKKESGAKKPVKGHLCELVDEIASGQSFTVLA